MQLSITGIHVDVGKAFHAYVEDGLATIQKKYNIDILDSTVQLSKSKIEFRSEVSAHLGRGVMLRGHGEGADANMSFDNALHKLESRLRRHKDRIIDHHKRRGSRNASQMVASYVLNPELPSNSAELAPTIIAEMETSIPTLTVSDAVMRLDLSGESAMMFQNEANDALNMVYRRSDGNIGWIDPQNEKK